MTYFVYTPQYSPSVGGIVALHRLASLIAEAGRTCFVVTPSTFSESKALVISAEYSKDNGPDVSQYCEGCSMVIYPEGTIGNPLNGDLVTRWILRDTGNPSYGADDFIFRFHERQNLEFNNGRFDGFMNVALFPTEMMDEKRKRFRWKVRLMIRKEKRRVMPLSWFIPLIDPLEKEGFDAMVDELSKCLLFISYDTKSGYSHIAAYLGACSVVIPNSQTSRSEYHSVYSGKYGVAYGWFDVPFAMMTRRRFKQRLRGLPERNMAQVLNYLKIVEG